MLKFLLPVPSIKPQFDLHLSEASISSNSQILSIRFKLTCPAELQWDLRQCQQGQSCPPPGFCDARTPVPGCRTALCQSAASSAASGGREKFCHPLQRLFWWFAFRAFPTCLGLPKGSQAVPQGCAVPPGGLGNLPLVLHYQLKPLFVFTCF